MRRGAWTFAFILIVLLAVAPPGVLAAAYTFTSINAPFPGVDETQAFGINSSGQIVGLYHDTAGDHGFLDDRGVFTAINVPGAGAYDTGAFGINARGQIVGRYDDATGGHGYLDTGGAFTPINVPFAGVTTTVAFKINASAQIVGTYFLSGEPNPLSHGFLDNGGVFTSIDVPLAGVQFTDALGINARGQIVGTYGDAAGDHGFLDNAGTFTTINAPFGPTQALDINDAGDIVGASGGHGFLDIGGSFSAIDVPFPGVISTEAHGINDAGLIVGIYTDATGEHGFLASPAIPEPPALFLLVSGLSGLMLLAYRQRRTRGCLATSRYAPLAGLMLMLDQSPASGIGPGGYDQFQGVWNGSMGSTTIQLDITADGTFHWVSTIGNSRGEGADRIRRQAAAYLISLPFVQKEPLNASLTGDPKTLKLSGPNGIAILLFRKS